MFATPPTLSSSTRPVSLGCGVWQTSVQGPGRSQADCPRLPYPVLAFQVCKGRLTPVCSPVTTSRPGTCRGKPAHSTPGSQGLQGHRVNTCHLTTYKKRP